MTSEWKVLLVCCTTAYVGASDAVDRQIGVDPALATGYSQLTGGPPSPWVLARGSLAAGYWQRSSGAAQGVGSNNVVNAEFQLPEVQPTRIRSATYQFSGRYSQCSGDEPVVFDVYAYPADGKADPADATAGTRVATLSANCRDNPAFNRPIDVTNIVRQLSVPSGVRFVGLSVRKGNNRRGPGYFFINPGKLNIVVADQDVAVAPGPVVLGGTSSGAPPASGSQVDVNRVIGGLIGAAGTLLGGGGSKPARDQAGNEATAVLSNPPMMSTDPGVAPVSTSPAGSEIAGAAATSTAGVAAPTVPSAAPVNVDIVGIKLGMTLDEVKRAVQAHSPGMRIDEHNGIINNAPATAYMSWLIAKSGKGAPAGSTDAIGVHFPPPPNAHRALFVERFTGFPRDQQPLSDAIKEALVKKFGPPSAVREGAGDHHLLWTFNAAGVQIIENSTLARCAKFTPTDPPARGQNILFNGYKSQGCGVTVHARIGRASLNGPLSDYLSVSLIDDSSFEEIRQAAARFANQATRDTASKVAVPKL